MATEEQKCNFRALLQKENDTWVAQCLEHDVLGQGRDEDSAVKSLIKGLICEMALNVEKGLDALTLCPASSNFVEEFNKCTSSHIYTNGKISYQSRNGKNFDFPVPHQIEYKIFRNKGDE